jgi:CheY-like chemotaxis protein
MPEMNGYEVARVLRGDERLRSVKLIAVTGYGKASDRERATRAGFDAHLVKPVDLEQLLTVIRTMRGRVESTGARTPHASISGYSRADNASPTN